MFPLVIRNMESERGEGVVIVAHVRRSPDTHLRELVSEIIGLEMSRDVKLWEGRITRFQRCRNTVAVLM